MVTARGAGKAAGTITPIASRINPCAGPDLGACPAQSGLTGLADELRALMANVQSRIGDAPAPAPAAEAPHRGATAAELALGTARRIYRDRRRRAELFNGDLFSEPAWDMLLDLYIAACEDRQVSTTSACIGANVPVATGLRWIQLLENEGLIVRNADPSDARRTWISLTASARRSMRRYLGGMAESQTGQAQGAIAA